MSVSTAWVGDWWLGPSGPPFRGRTDASWRQVFASGGWQLWIQELKPAGSVNWVGAPWRESVSDDGSRRWRFGEVCRDEAGPGVNGHATALAWTGEAWRVETNRLGTLHAYVGPQAASSSFEAARYGSSGRIDGDGVAAFCAFGFFLDDRTHLDDVRILPPATRWTAPVADEMPSPEAGRERWWSWPERTQRPSNTARSDAGPDDFDDAVDQLAAVLREVLADEGRGRVAVPISGGLDSRSTVALMPQPSGDDRHWYFGYGWGARSVEIHLAERVAAARRRTARSLGLPSLDFQSFGIEPYLPESIDAVAAALEGFVDLVQPRQAAVAPRLGELADTVIAAHWGDVWLDEPSAPGDTVLDRALALMRRNGSSWLLEHFAASILGESSEQVEERLRERVRAGLSRFEFLVDPAWRLKAYKTEQWSHRWTTASLRAYQLGLFPRLPFYDDRLVDFVARLPGSWLAGRRLQIELLRRHAPDLARVAWQQTGLPLDAGPVRRALALPERAWRKTGRWLRRERVIERNWEIQLQGPDGRRLLEERLLVRGRRIHDIVDRRAVRALLDRFATDSDPATAYAVSQLLTLAVRWETL